VEADNDQLLLPDQSLGGLLYGWFRHGDIFPSPIPTAAGHRLVIPSPGDAKYGYFEATKTSNLGKTCT
jgi:hypothetical protein